MRLTSEIMALFELLYLIAVKNKNYANFRDLWTSDGSGT